MTDATLPEDRALADRALRVAQTAADALAWAAAHPEAAREGGAALARDLRRFGLRARKLATAAARPMCVSVFGPSQSGKSYLISALARKGAEPVRVVFDREAVDFVAEINPEGGKEATGLVTRFTMRPMPGLPGKPVSVRLLTQTDVVKILGNSFLEDFNRDAITPLPQAEVASLLDAMRSRATAAPGVVDEDAVFDLQEYFERYFRGHPVILALGAAFWREAAALAPRLSVADRARLFGVLWNGLPAYTDTCRRLAEALASLGDPDEAFMGTEALMPRTTSIIDVETLAGLGAPDGTATLEIATRDGRKATLPRPVVAALVAELRLTLSARPWDFFAGTDLLDFPGARSREVLSDPDTYLAEPARVAPLYLRGKVAYLYQRYVAEQELTAMLLCIGPSNQEVRTLPGMVKEWVDATHGATPEERAKQPTALFVVLTKFDMEFEEKRGRREDEPGQGTRWATRIEASITRFLGLEHAWPQEWTPGQPFTNTFWLRNPNVAARALLTYDAEGRETGEVDPARMRRLREEFLATPEVQRHFADPARAWGEAMRLNDGGVTYLAERLAPVCNPALKRGQVAGRLATLVRQLAARLDPFHISDDREAERAKRKAEGQALLPHLAACLQAQRFGLMLRAMQVEAEALSHAFYRLLLHAPEDGGQPAPVSGAAVRAADLAGDLAGLFGAAPEPAPADAGSRTDVADQLAETALAEWQEQLRCFGADPATASFLLVPREQATFLATQVATGAAWQDLRGRIAEAIRTRTGFHERLADSLVKPVMIAERAVNDYVATLGFDRMPEAERPRTPRENRVVFAPREAAEDLPALGPLPRPFERDFAIDWATAFARLVDLNVDHAFGGRIDTKANAELGRILAVLRSAG